MKRSSLLFAIIAVFSFSQGCASTQVAAPISAQSAGQDASDDYRAALHEALDLYQAQVRHASRVHYGDYASAERVHLRLRTPTIEPALAAALERRGHTLDDLNAYAAQNQAFVREQNEIARERIANVRGDLYAVLGRFSPVADPMPAAQVAPPQEYSAFLAIPTPASGAVSTAKDQ